MVKVIYCRSIIYKVFNLKIRLLNHRYKRVRSISAENRVGLSCKDWTMYGTVTFPRLFLAQETRCVISVLAQEIKLKTKKWNTFLFDQFEGTVCLFHMEGLLEYLISRGITEPMPCDIFSQQCYLFEQVWGRIAVIQFRTQTVVLMKKRS